MEGQAAAEVGVRAWGSLAGTQQEGSKEAEAASRSPPEAVQSLHEEQEQDRLCRAFSDLYNHISVSDCE